MTNTVIFGTAGTGKNSTLLQYVNQELNAGVAPERIAFVSFTKAAVEAVYRSTKQFGNSNKQFRWFRTLHSMCFAALGTDREAMLTDYSDFAAQSGLRFSRSSGENSLAGSATDGDQFLAGHGLCA